MRKTTLIITFLLVLVIALSITTFVGFTNSTEDQINEQEMVKRAREIKHNSSQLSMIPEETPTKVPTVEPISEINEVLEVEQDCRDVIVILWLPDGSGIMTGRETLCAPEDEPLVLSNR